MRRALERFEQATTSLIGDEERLLKDSVLDRLAKITNVAQFVSFGPNLNQRHARVRGYDEDHLFGSIEAAAVTLLDSAGSVNVRSFEPQNAKSREFVYGLKSPQQVIKEVSRLASLGLYTIVNETVDVNDGGVSGVALGNVIEFAPSDTPRCVEKPGTLSLPRALGMTLLEKVYSFVPNLSQFDFSQRVEFSVHPIKRGVRHEHTIVWELEDVGHLEIHPEITWPNRFSRFIGDKAFGLLLADTLGLPVPTTKVFGRALPPFSFGIATGSGETWIRTCPVEQEPGKYSTHRGWLDPFELMAREDPEGTRIPSVLAQEGIDAQYSGSLIVERDGSVTVEGVPGYGDDFMLGRSVGNIPKPVRSSVLDLFQRTAALLGAVRFEWVHDAEKTWIVQLHKGATVSLGNTIYPGDASVFHRFDVREGIDSLRNLVQKIRGLDEGVIIIGQVGITSHLGDILRKAKIPSRIES